MSIDWNWGILQQALFGNTTYLADLEWLSGDDRFVDLRPDYRFPSSVHFRHFTYRSKLFLSGLGTLYVELFRNVPLIVQFFTRTGDPGAAARENRHVV